MMCDWNINILFVEEYKKNKKNTQTFTNTPEIYTAMEINRFFFLWIVQKKEELSPCLICSSSQLAILKEFATSSKAAIWQDPGTAPNQSEEYAGPGG